MFWRHCPCFGASNDDEVSSGSSKTLDFSHLKLEDVPAEVFQRERTLEELYLDNNSIKDLPRQLFHCTGLRVLSLSDNDIQTIPSAIASLINLKRINLNKNTIQDIPDNFRICSELLSVDVSVNPIGKLPDSFTQLLNLQELYLNDTFIEFLPANFGRLSKLKVLELRENHLKTLPKSLMRLSLLEKIDIGQNDLMEIPEVIGTLFNMKELWCDSNRLQCIPAFIGGLTKLEYLDVSNNQISEISDALGCCESIADITLTSNKLTKLPETLGELRKVVTLRVDNNDLIELPHGIGNWSALEELIISCNRIRYLPSTIGFIRSLKTLIADYNEIVELPSSIGSCASLRLLAISNNTIEYLPNEIGRLSNLQVLNLSGNRLKNLPLSLAKLSSLKALWLSDNQQKPIMTLQQDHDENSEQTVLTCFLLPQLAAEDVVTCHEHITNAQSNPQVITFATGIAEDNKVSTNLLRNPTPYPKELKAHARHAKNLALKRKDSGVDQQDIVPNGHSPDDAYDNEIELPKPVSAVPVLPPIPMNTALRANPMACRRSEITQIGLMDNMQENPCHSKSYSFIENAQEIYVSHNRKPFSLQNQVLIDDRNRFHGSDSNSDIVLKELKTCINDSLDISLDSTMNRVKSRKPLYFNEMQGINPQQNYAELVEESMVVHPADDTRFSATFLETNNTCINTSNGFPNDTDANSASSITSQYASSESDRGKSSLRSSYASTNHQIINSETSDIHAKDLNLNRRNIPRMGSHEKSDIHSVNQIAFNQSPQIIKKVSEFENISENSSSSSSTNRHHSNSNASHRKFPVMIIKNPDAGFSIADSLTPLGEKVLYCYFN